MHEMEAGTVVARNRGWEHLEGGVNIILTRYKVYVYALGAELPTLINNCRCFYPAVQVQDCEGGSE